MDSPEGEGKAKRFFDASLRGVNRAIAPIAVPTAQVIARGAIEDVLGFWVLWHIYGGFEGLVELGMHKSTVWRKVARFRKVTGVHPDVFTMPGITLDPEMFWKTAPKQEPEATPTE